MNNQNPLAQLTDDLRSGLDGKALDDFNAVVECVEEADALSQMMSNPPAWVGMEDDALRAVIQWIDVMSQAVHHANRGTIPNGSDATPLAIVSGFVLGYAYRAREA